VAAVVAMVLARAERAATVLLLLRRRRLLARAEGHSMPQLLLPPPWPAGGRSRQPGLAGLP
jgi:hypothetical protein